MPVLVMCQDSEDAPTLRETHKKAHLEYIETIVAMVCVAGPLSQSAEAIENDTYEGSCFIYDTDDLAIAHKLLKHDPYAKAGVYREVAFAKFKAAAGHWIGGVSWK